MCGYNIFQKRWMQQLFREVASQFKSANQYEKFIKEAAKEFDIKIYRLHLFPVSQALLVYKEQCAKYEKKAVEVMDCAWHENERRVYVWFIVCYVHYKLLDANRLLDGQKHWNQISQTFWGKNVEFLKYQLQTIVKNRGRTTWKGQQDQLLREIYPKHQKGQWNQIAKEFYFKSRGEFFKTAKQCRQRWQNHLNSAIRRGDWSPQQDLILFEQVKKSGKKWARIIPLLKNLRTEHMIKNRYNSEIKQARSNTNLTEIQAIDAIICKLTEASVQRPRKEDKLDYQADNSAISSEVIEFVQSEEIIDEVQEMKEVEAKKKKGGRRKLSQRKSFEQMKIKANEPTKTDMNFEKSSQYKYEIQGCKVIGASMQHINHYVYVHKSDSFSQSNSNSKSIGIPNFFNSGQFSGNYSIHLSNGSLMPLETITFKDEKGEKMEKRQLELESIKSLRSNSSRQNESVFFRCMN